MTVKSEIDLGFDPVDFLLPGCNLGFRSPVSPESEDCRALFREIASAETGLLAVVSGLVEVFETDPLFVYSPDIMADVAPLIRVADLALHSAAADSDKSRAPSVRLIARSAMLAGEGDGLEAIQERTRVRRPRLYSYLAATSWMPPRHAR